MNSKTKWIVLLTSLMALLLLAAVTAYAGSPAQDPQPPDPADAQPAPLGTDASAPLSTGFTYQGKLEGSSGPISATCTIAFRLYDQAASGAQVGSPLTRTVSIDNGLFTESLDFGASAFDGQARWLGILVKCPGDTAFTDMGRQALTAAPHALYALKAPWSGLTGVPVGFADGVDNNTTYSAGTGLSLAGTTFSADTTYLQRRVTGTCGAGNAIRVIAADGTVTCQAIGAPWLLSGNAGTTPGTNFLGTTDNQALELKVNNARALRLEPAANDSPNLIGGYSGNSVTSGVAGATISGGGFNGSTNRVTDDYGTVGGGGNNLTGDSGATTNNNPYATVGGGYGNSATRAYATVGGGDNNTASGVLATVGGGHNNDATNQYATVSGGYYNAAGGDWSAIGGGDNNTASEGYATVGGGGYNTASEGYATIGGGYHNAASGSHTAIGGGYQNIASANSATIGGGGYNTAGGQYAAIGGGGYNTASGLGAVVAGGGGYSSGIITNTASGDWSVIGGGAWNTASNQYATVGGGVHNTASGKYATVGGGGGFSGSTAVTNTARGDWSTIGGGAWNTASGAASTVPGGNGNIAQGTNSFAAGTKAYAQHNGAFVWGDDTYITLSSPAAKTFVVRAGGGIWLGTTSSPSIPAGRFINTSTGGYLTTGGAWTNSSDRNMKEHFATVDPQQVLASLATIPIQSWNYKAENAAVRHMGPVAQDFYAAFGLGSDDTSIATVDADGVALAAIQGLYEQNVSLQAKSVALEQENASLRARMDDLETRLAALEQGNASGASQSGLPFGAWLLLGGLALAACVVVQRRRSGGSA